MAPKRPTALRLPLLAALWAAAACGSRPEPGGDCPAVEQPRSYAQDVAPMLQQRCTPCHASTLKTLTDRSGAPLGIDYDGLANARRNADAGNQDVVNGRMPLGGALTGSDVCLLDAWVQTGYLP